MNQTNENQNTNADAKLLLGEVLPDKKPEVIIVAAGGELGVSLNVRMQLEKEFGKELIIVSPEDALKKGLQKQEPFEREPIILKAIPPLVEPFIDTRNNQPWYTQFKKKGKMRR